MCAVHGTTHSYVYEWSQRMQRLQTETAALPNVQSEVLAVQVLASGGYHSENHVSLKIL